MTGHRSGDMPPLADAAIEGIARNLLAQVIEDSRRDAAATVRARLTAALVEEMWQTLGRDAAGAERPASAAAPVPATASGAAPAAADHGAEVGASGWYVYGLTWDAATSGLGAERGVDDAPLECIREGRLAAVVSRVTNSRRWGLGDGGDLDMGSLAPRARAHERVLERLLDAGAVLPLRFGVMYPDDGDLRRLLQVRSTAIESELARLDGHSEWGLTVSVAPAAGLVAVRDIHTGGGRDYLDRRRSERDQAEQRRRQESRVRDVIHDTLLAVASDGVILGSRPTSPETGERCVLRASYLVPSTRVDEFRRAAESVLVSASGEMSLGGELTGPWPAYHFTDLRLDGEGVPA